MLPKIKSKAFIRLLPQIFALREQGYSYEEVTAILEKQHGLILSVKQFSVYLARYKNTNAKKSAKQIAGSASPPYSINKMHSFQSTQALKWATMRLDHLNTKRKFKRKRKNHLDQVKK